MLQLLLLLALLVALAWIAFYLLLFALAAGAVTAVIVYVRRWLIAKGIVAPQAGAQSNVDADTIEVEYSEITITQDDDNKEQKHG